ncbi:hypothetical protein TNCV_4212361 [Trichonephila clavipes]|nr:hypothetical protein TNCV_4212361 [Trichonephila clavipes]
MRVWKQWTDEHRTTLKTDWQWTMEAEVSTRRSTPAPHGQHMQLFPWPANSPDVSPIEHVWDLVDRRLVCDPRPVPSKDERTFSAHISNMEFSSTS